MHPNILLPCKQVESICSLEKNYLKKHRSVELTAQAPVKAGIGMARAAYLHL